jgi:hypothetical protein
VAFFVLSRNETHPGRPDHRFLPPFARYLVACGLGLLGRMKRYTRAPSQAF